MERSATQQGQNNYPPGWYNFHGGRRFWDGERWTDHLAPPAAARASKAAPVLLALGAALGVGGCSFLLAPLIWFWIPIAMGAVGLILASLSTTSSVRGAEPGSTYGAVAAVIICAAAIGVGILMRNDLEDKVGQDTLVSVDGATGGNGTLAPGRGPETMITLRT